MRPEHQVAAFPVEIAAETTGPTPVAGDALEHAATLVSPERADESSAETKAEELRRYLDERRKESRAG